MTVLGEYWKTVTFLKMLLLSLLPKKYNRATCYWYQNEAVFLITLFINYLQYDKHMMLMFSIVLLILISDGVSERPCLSNESVRNLYKSRNTLKEVQTHFGKLVNTLETKTLKTLESDLKQAVSIMDRYGGKMIVDILKNSFGIFKTALGSMEQKIQHLDNELIVFGKNIQSKFRYDIKYDVGKFILITFCLCYI